MTLMLQLIGMSLTVPGAIVAVAEIRKRRAGARNVSRPRVLEVDLSVRLRIRRR